MRDIYHGCKVGGGMEEDSNGCFCVNEWRRRIRGSNW